MIIPTGQYILIKPDSTEEITSGGILRPKKPIANTGEVLRVSEDADTSVGVGDRVLYLPNGRVENEDGTICVKEENILFVFN
jgi:co-chaperonin GroES (HSP10)